MLTTLNSIKKYSSDESFWADLLNYLGKSEADDEPISIFEILKIKGLKNAIWCMQAVDGYDKEIRMFAILCVRKIQHLIEDKRSLNALDVAEAFANGDASEEELKIAWSIASDAAWDAWVNSTVADSDSSRAAFVAASYAARAASWAASISGAVCAASLAANAASAEAMAIALANQEKELIKICGLSKISNSNVLDSVVKQSHESILTIPRQSRIGRFIC
jgi:hypothetical protein